MRAQDLSVLVHNGGDTVGHAYMVAIIGGVETTGPVIEIGPGSSREVSSSLSPITNGSLDVAWSIESNDADDALMMLPDLVRAYIWCGLRLASRNDAMLGTMS